MKITCTYILTAHNDKIVLNWWFHQLKANFKNQEVVKFTLMM